jgi:basic amino acid/polyamine antiporter, APA family
VLLSYLLSALASMKAEGGHAPRRSTQIFGFLAYCYSLFALIGTGDEALSWGLVLLLAGWPMYALRTRWKKLPTPTLIG